MYSLYPQDTTFSIYVEDANEENSGVYYFGWHRVESEVYYIQPEEVIMFHQGDLENMRKVLISGAVYSYDSAVEEAENWLHDQLLDEEEDVE